MVDAATVVEGATVVGAAVTGGTVVVGASVTGAGGAVSGGATATGGGGAATGAPPFTAAKVTSSVMSAAPAPLRCRPSLEVRSVRPAVAPCQSRIVTFG